VPVAAKNALASGAHAPGVPASPLPPLAPPYSFDDWPALLAGLDAGLVVVESDRGLEQALGWHVERVRRYAGTVVTLLSPEDGDPGSSPP